MPNAFGQLTDEERRIAALRAGTMSPAAGMVSPYENQAQKEALRAQAAYDPSTKQAQMAQLLRTGTDALMDTGAAQGKMAGDVYVAPTWSEIAANAVKQGLGGYQMRKANQGLDEVVGRNRQKAEAEGILAEEAQQKLDKQQAIENKIAEDRLQQQKDEAEATRKAAEARDRATQADRDRRYELAQARIDAAAAAKDKNASAKINQYVRDYSRDLNKAGIPRARTVMDTLLTTLEPFKTEDGA